jgi:Zn finger protein HypA/HybF involved in hydrogenase expression
LTENSVRDISTIKELESLKYEYQIRCSHYQLEFISNDKIITCPICGKTWNFVEEKGFSKIIEIYKAELD